MYSKLRSSQYGGFMTGLTFIIAIAALLLAVYVYLQTNELKQMKMEPQSAAVEKSPKLMPESKEALADKQKEQELELRIHLLQSKAEVAAARLELATQKGKEKTRVALQKAIDELNTATKQAEEKAKPQLEKLKKQLEGINQEVEKGAKNTGKKLEEWTKSLESMMQGKKEDQEKK